MSVNELFGVIVPVVTPVDSEDRVDESSFRRLIRHLIDSGVHAIFAGGSCGEGPLLTDAEWRRMAEIAFDEVDGRVPVLAGAMDSSTVRVKDKIKALIDIGYWNIVVTPSYYIGAGSDSEQLRHFGAAKEACGNRELVAYNIPPCTGTSISERAICEMAKRGWVRYYKDTSCDLDYFKRVLVEAGSYGLKMLSGDEMGMAEGLRAGAVGIIPGCANYDPKTFVRLYDAAGSGDVNEMDRLQKRIVDIREALMHHHTCWLSGVKYAVSVLGAGNGMPISPLEPLDADQMKRVDEFIALDGFPKIS